MKVEMTRIIKRKANRKATDEKLGEYLKDVLTLHKSPILIAQRNGII